MYRNKEDSIAYQHNYYLDKKNGIKRYPKLNYKLISEDLVFIFTEKGDVVIVNASDDNPYNTHKLCVGNHGYAEFRHQNKGYLLHRVIMGNPIGLEIDHINGDRLDNRKCNLRICSRKDNSKNYKIDTNNSSGRKGIYWNKHAKKWIASIGIDGQQKYLGLFICFKKAIEARKEAEKKYFGEFSRKEPTQINGII